MTDTVLHVSDLHLSRGACPVLRGMSFQAARGALVAVMGASGSGKTTVLRVIAGLEPFQSGRIVVSAGRPGGPGSPGVAPGPGDSRDDVALQGGEANSAATLRRLRRQVGMVFQFHCLFEHLSAIDNVCLAPIHAHGVEPRDAVRRGHELLTAFGVAHRASALPRELSGGEAQRVAIARALAVDPPVLLMDEPTASLDPPRRAELGELLHGLLRQQRTLVVATHDEEFVRGWATHVVRVADGRVI
jgi:ABC-type polar amino acid transport system ATPase subunit